MSRRSSAAASSIALALAMLTAPISAAFAQSPSAIPSAGASAATNPLEIEVIGLRSDSGEVGCSLFLGAQGFPRDDSRVMRHVWAPVHEHKALCRFDGLASGRYAAVVFHDENGDHEFNMNAFSMPTEGYGFSNDAAALFSPPEFEAAAFDYVAGRSLYLVINIRY